MFCKHESRYKQWRGKSVDFPTRLLPVSTVGSYLDSEEDLELHSIFQMFYTFLCFAFKLYQVPWILSCLKCKKIKGMRNSRPMCLIKALPFCLYISILLPPFVSLISKTSQKVETNLSQQENNVRQVTCIFAFNIFKISLFVFVLSLYNLEPWRQLSSLYMRTLS